MVKLKLKSSKNFSTQALCSESFVTFFDNYTGMNILQVKQHATQPSKNSFDKSAAEESHYTAGSAGHCTIYLPIAGALVVCCGQHLIIFTAFSSFPSHSTTTQLRAIMVEYTDYC